MWRNPFYYSVFVPEKNQYFAEANRVQLWRIEYCHSKYYHEYKEFSARNKFASEVETVFGEVFVNPDNVNGSDVYGILDYTHNINR